MIKTILNSTKIFASDEDENLTDISDRSNILMCVYRAITSADMLGDLANREIFTLTNLDHVTISNLSLTTPLFLSLNGTPIVASLYFKSTEAHGSGDYDGFAIIIDPNGSNRKTGEIVG